jgi:hypothetical protein
MIVGWLALPLAASIALASGCTTMDRSRPAAAPSNTKKPVARGAKAEQPSDWWHSSVTIENASHWAIHHLYLTPFNATSWGPDQLGEDTIGKGQRFQLKGIDCDRYDIKLVDELGDECVVEDVDLCLQDPKWVLDDDALVGCQVKTAQIGKSD